MALQTFDGVLQSEAAPDAELVAAIRDSVRSFARARAARSPGRVAVDRTWEWGQFAEAGWLGLLAPQDRGGSELPASVLAAFYQAIGEAGVTENYSAVGVLALSALACCEPTSLRDQLIEDLVAGSARPVLCWQEADESDDRLAFAPATLEGREPGPWLRRAFIDCAATATHFCFPVNFDAQNGLLVVDRRSAGLGCALSKEINGGELGAVFFGGRAKPSRFIALREAGTLAPAFRLARIAAAAHLAGLSRRMVDLTSEYLGVRVQFGKPIVSNQVVQHRLVDMWGQVELSKAAATRAGAAASREGADAEAEAERAAVAAKARAGAAAEFVVKWAFQLHGAIGYTGECELGGLAKSALSLSQWLGGPRELRRRFVALERDALTEA